MTPKEMAAKRKQDAADNRQRELKAAVSNTQSSFMSAENTKIKNNHSEAKSGVSMNESNHFVSTNTSFNK
jgi:hypothetical protein